MQPSYQSGFYAPGRGVAKHPELWRGCVGAWNPGLGNTGLVLRDWSGNGNNGTLTGGPTWGVTDGRQALDFDGADDYVDCGISLIPIGAKTILAWIKTTSNPVAIFDTSGTSTSNHGITLFVDSAAGQLRCISVKGTIGDSRFDIMSSASVNNGEWHHVAMSWAGTTTNASLFVDGIKDGTGASATTETVAGSNTLRIGSLGNPFPTSWRFNGQIADARIYNRALSPQEIRTLAQRPGIAYELAPRKTYFVQAATSTSQFYDVLSPLIFAGTN